MPFKVPTYDELTAFGIAVGRAVLNELNWSRWGSPWKWFRVVAAIGTDIHAGLVSAKDDLLADRASEAYLARHAAMYQVPRKEATSARKTNALRVYGDEAAVVAIGDTLTHQGTGLRFEVTSAGTIGAGETYVTVSIQAIDTGTQTRLSAGEYVFFDDTPAGLQEKAEIVLDLDVDGDDLESIEAWRQRVLAKMGDPPLGGARADYETWAKAVTGVDTAYVYPLRRGMGSVDLAALHPGDGANRLLSAGEITELQAAIDAKRPVATKPFRVLTVDSQAVDVSLAVGADGQPEHEWYWTDSTPLEVLTWVPSGNGGTLTFTTARPDDMAAGHTLTVKPAASGAGGRELVIESLSGANAVIIEELFEDDDPFYDVPDPDAGDLVYSGGPLVAPLREAARLHFRTLGPTNPDGDIYGPWESQVRPEAFGRLALIKALDEAVEATDRDSDERTRLAELAEVALGTKHVDVELPTATVEPTDDAYPDDGTVHLCIPGMILVHRAW